jgi:hypothetical protein
VAHFTASASGRPQPSVQWQVSKDLGKTWANDVADAGANSETLTVVPTLAQNGWEYRAVFSNVVNKANSGVATLIVSEPETAPEVVEEPADASVVEGEGTIFTARAEGRPTPSVQWERSIDGGSTWSNDTSDKGSKTDSLVIAKAALSDSGHEYRAVFRNGSGKAESRAATLVVSKETVPLTVTQQPEDLTVVAGEPATFTSVASGVPPPTGVQWEVSTDGGAHWSADTVDPGSESAMLTVTAAAAAQNGWEYRAVFSNFLGEEIASAPATLTVDTAPAITVAPLDDAVTEGESATFTAAASGRPAPAVSWEVSTDGGVTWTADTTDSGANTNVLTLVATSAAQNGYEYRAVFTNSVETKRTGPARLTVNSRPPSPPPPGPPPGPPVAGFTWFPTHPHTGETVTLVSTSTDAFAAINSFAWDPSGSGSPVPGPSVTTTTFAKPGTHAVTLRVGDTNGNTAAVTESIGVSSPALALMQPFPVVRIAGSDTSSGARLTLVTVQAPAGATVSISCRGHGCPRHTETRTLPGGSGAGGGALLTFRRFQRRLRAGAVLQIRVTHAGEIGKYTRFTIRRGHLPVRVDACIDPSLPAPIACPVQ